MSLTPQQKHFFTLYKNILKIHKQVLPFEMRVIGNSFVKYALVSIKVILTFYSHLCPYRDDVAIVVLVFILLNFHPSSFYPSFS